MLSILLVSGLACDRQTELATRSIQCGAAGFRSLPGDDCTCEPGFRSLSGDCVPEDDDTGETDDSRDSDDCRADGSNCDDSGAATTGEEECRRADGSLCDDDEGGEDGGEDSGDDSGEDGGEDSGEEPPPASCGYRTQTQGGWGATCNGGNPGCFRDAHFDDVFGEGLYVGCGVLTANLTSSLAVEQALPTGGKPRALLPGEAVAYDGIGDPQVKTVLFGQVVALSLSVAFDPLADYDEFDQVVPLGSLEIADPASVCFGMLVSEVLTQANYALGGCPSQLSAAAANDCVTAINESYVDGSDSCSALFAPPPAL